MTELRLIKTSSVDERLADTTTARKFGTTRMVGDWRITLP